MRGAEQRTLGFVCDPVEDFKPYKDTTFALMLAAQARGWQLVVFGPADLWVEGGRACGRGRKLTVKDDPKQWFIWQGEPAVQALGALDAILMRVDPPVDARYIAATWVLELAEAQGALVLNKPAALRDYNEKLATAWFPDYSPPTLFAADLARLRDFHAEHGDVIYKPIDGMGGRGIFRVQPDGLNLGSVIEQLSDYGRVMITAQKYLPAIADGDTRVLIVHGQPVDYGLARIPQAGETRGNLAAGGRGEARPLTAAQRRIATALGPRLLAKGLWFVGLDVIGEHLTEINITSPTCAREIDAAFGTDIAGQLTTSAPDLMHRSLPALLILAGFAGVLAAHDAPVNTITATALTPTLERIRDAAVSSDYAYRQTAMLTDEVGARLSGSRGAAVAVERVAAELRALGLDVRLEPVKVPHWVRGVETAVLTDWSRRAEGLRHDLAVTALGGSVATSKKGLAAEVLPVRDFQHLAALGRERVAGRIVLFTAAFDEQMAAVGRASDAYSAVVAYRGNGASKAAALGAAAVLVRSAGPIGNYQPHTGSLRYAEDAPKIPAGALAAEDALLIERLAAKGPVQMRLTLTPQILPDADSFNVVADLKGRELPDEVVIVSGHLDSWDLGPSAQDDATGVAAAMHVAAVFKQLGLTPRRTLRVIAWMNEENGVMGGKTYALKPAAEMGQHAAAIEMDFGAGHPTGIAANVTPATLPLLKPISEVLAGIGAGVVDFRLGGVGVDIGPLSKLGVPGFAPLTDGSGYFAIHHTAADTLDKINPRHLAENAAVMSVLSYALAEGEALPRLPVTP